MRGIADRLRRIVGLDRASVRWAVGLLIAAGALLIWFALNWDGDRHAETVPPSASGADVVPPVEDDIDQATSPSQSTPQDVIPPAEP